MTDVDLQALADSIAQKVMGWERKYRRWACPGEHWWWYKGDKPIVPCTTWLPWQNWNQMGMVLEAMRNSGYLWRIESSLGESDIGIVAFRKGCLPLDTDLCQVGKVPLVVCLAASNAVRGEQAEDEQ